MLIDLQTVILQDAAALHLQYPTLSIFQFKPFSTSAFREFAATAGSILAQVQADALQQYCNLPEHLVASLRGIVMNVEIQRKQAETVATQQLNYLTGLIENTTMKNHKTKTRKLNGKYVGYAPNINNSFQQLLWFCQFLYHHCRCRYHCRCCCLQLPYTHLHLQKSAIHPPL